MQIGQRIGQLAKEKNINLHQLAILSGVSYNTLYSIVRRNSSKVNPETLKKVAAALGVQEVELITGHSVADLQRQMEKEARSLAAALNVVPADGELSAFLVKHPKFIDALNTVGITIRPDGRNIYAEYDGMTIEITLEDLQQLREAVYSDFLYSIQKFLFIPVYDEHEHAQAEEHEKDSLKED